MRLHRRSPSGGQNIRTMIADGHGDRDERLRRAGVARSRPRRGLDIGLVRGADGVGAGLGRALGGRTS